MRRLPCRLVQSFKPARELASGISYVSLSCLGWREPAVLGSALSLMPSTAEAQTALPAVTVEAPRATAARPAARKPALRTSARTQARPASTNPAPFSLAHRGHYPERGARAPLPGAGRPDRDVHRPQPVRQQAVFFGGDMLRDSPGISIKQGNGPRDSAFRFAARTRATASASAIS